MLKILQHGSTLLIRIALTNSSTGQFKAALVLLKKQQKRAPLNCR